MELWTDYEGRTVAGEYVLGRLRRSEGRNGFFSTTDAAGKPKVIRLTEPHYDEEEQLNRWRTVAALKQPALIAIERVGRTNLDDGGEPVDLTYAVLEAEDAVLSDVLAERPLTTAETLQVAISVATAMATLHSLHLVHEHIDADNVMAVGNDVKLRSDRVRLCVEDGEFVSAEQVAATRAKDLHDFGLLLIRCLTLEPEYHPGMRLPAHFLRVIPEALEGSTTFERIAHTLAPPPPPAPVPVAPAAQPASTATVPSGSVPAASVAAAVAAATAASAAPAAATPVQRSLPLESPEPRISEARPFEARPFDGALEEQDGEEDLPPSRLLPFDLPKNWPLWAAGALVLLFLLWHFVGGHKSAKSDPAAVQAALASAASPAAQDTAHPVNVVVRRDGNTSPASERDRANGIARAANTAPGWHVIAYTFYRQDQAQSRANAIAAKHPGLNPQVFSPTGRAPFLVALGGSLDEQSARRLVREARHQGMPRDTFARNYRRD